MYSTNIRNQFHLHWQKVVFLLLFAICTNAPAFAQKGHDNLPRHDYRFMHYGFILGAATTNFQIRASEYFMNNQDTASLISMQSRRSPSFSLGFLLNFNLDGEYWALRVTPNVTFYEQSVLFKYPSEKVTPDNPNEYRNYKAVDERVESAFFEFPVMLKFRSEKRHNTRFYLIGGFTPAVKVGGAKTKFDKSRLATADYNLEITYGFGVERYLPFFKFAPEFRFSHGLGDVLWQNGSPYAQNISRITTHRFGIYLNFE